MQDKKTPRNHFFVCLENILYNFYNVGGILFSDGLTQEDEKWLCEAAVIVDVNLQLLCVVADKLRAPAELIDPIYNDVEHRAHVTHQRPMVTGLRDVINQVGYITCHVVFQTIFRLKEPKLPLYNLEVVLAQVVFDCRILCEIEKGAPYIAKLEFYVVCVFFKVTNANFVHLTQQ